nr:PRD domain-containing protein [uncultured Caproiciproducens sp.]
MKIVKIINNNVVYARDKGNEHVIVMGRGIGFSGKHGDVIAPEKIEKVIRMDSQNSMDRLISQLVELPEEHFKLSSDIVEYAVQQLGKELNKNVLVTLTDHISFAIQRYQKGLMFPNALKWEIKKFYPHEFAIGEYAVVLILRRLETEFSDDEAAFIAMHIVCAEYNSDMPDMMDATKLVSGVLKIVQEYLGGSLDEESFRMERFITHLRFLARRIIEGGEWKELDRADRDFGKVIRKMYPADYQFSQKIADFIEKNYSHKMSEMELSYLSIHIKNLRSGSL